MNGVPGDREDPGDLKVPADREASEAGSEAPGSLGGAERELTEARELRALTHPVRLALIEVLNVEGPLTATEAGELIGESATTCSFHLRQLAKYGFVEEAGGGTGRRRPWRLAVRSFRFSPTPAEDPEQSVAANALERMIIKRWLARLEQWERSRMSEPPEWQAVSDAFDSVVYLTPSEVAEVTGAMTGVLERFRERQGDPSRRPEGSRSVEITMFSFPVRFGQPLPPADTP